MKANSFLNQIIDNLHIKIICFVIALTLFLFYQTGQVKTDTVLVPLDLEQEGGVELVEPVQSSVKVTVRTAEDVIVHPEDFKAVLNLENLTQTGVYDIPVTLTLSDNLLSVDPLEVKLRQEFVTVHVEKRTSGAAFVLPETIGEVQHGYSVKEITVDPKIVQITGPESVVNSENVFRTEAVSLEGLSGNKNFLVQLQKTNKRLHYEDAQTYLISVAVEPVIVEKEISGINPVFRNLSEKLQVEPGWQSSSVKVSGPLVIVQDLTSYSCSYNIDLSSVTEPGEYEFPCEIRLPPSVSIIEKSDDVILLKVTAKPESDETVDENNQELQSE